MGAATWIDIVREFFPGASDGECESILWERTGFPCFWPDGDKTPEDNCREQLAQFKTASALGVPLCDFCNNPATKSHLCDNCGNALTPEKGE